MKITKETNSDNHWEERQYETEEQMNQAVNDFHQDGKNVQWSSSGGNADGTGGEYCISIQRD